MAVIRPPEDCAAGVLLWVFAVQIDSRMKLFATSYRCHVIAQLNVFAVKKMLASNKQ